MKKGKLDLNYEPIGRNPIPISVGNVKQLLCDDFFLAMAAVDKWDQLFYNVQFANGIVQKHGSPVMEGDEGCPLLPVMGSEHSGSTVML